MAVSADGIMVSESHMAMWRGAVAGDVSVGGEPNGAGVAAAACAARAARLALMVHLLRRLPQRPPGAPPSTTQHLWNFVKRSRHVAHEQGTAKCSG